MTTDMQPVRPTVRHLSTLDPAPTPGTPRGPALDLARGPADGQPEARPARRSTPGRIALPGAPVLLPVGSTRDPGPAVRTGADALALVRRLSGAPRLGRTLTLWLVLLTEPDRDICLLLPVPDLPRRPCPTLAAGLMTAMAECAAQAASDQEVGASGPGLLLGYARREGGARGGVEGAWSAALRAAAATQRVRIVAEVTVGARRSAVLPATRAVRQAA